MAKPSWKPRIEYVVTEENRRAMVKNGNDSIDICRVVNGMWQANEWWVGSD